MRQDKSKSQKRTSTFLALSIGACIYLQACEKSNSPQEEQDNQEMSTAIADGVYTQEEASIFIDHGDNSLGINKSEYDLAVVVSPSQNTFSLRDTNDQKVVKLDTQTEAENENDSKEDEESNDEENQDAPEKMESEDLAKTKINPIAEISDTEIEACSKFFGKKVTGITVSGKKKSVNVQPDHLIAVKLSGNKNSINLLLTSEDFPIEDSDTEKSYDLEGICIIASGNQVTTNLVLNGLRVKSVYYQASGNQPSAFIEIKEGAEISTLSSEMKGNSAKLTITGDGIYDCEGITTKGNASTPACGPDLSGTNAQ